MIIISKYPPNYEKICKRFPIRNRTGIIFTYGNKLYNPGNGIIPDHLKIHEETHARQQQEHKNGIDGWWEQYFNSSKFRLSQELEAYRNQYKSIRSRKERRLVLKNIAKDLSSDLYGNLVTYKKAKKLIME